MCRGVANPPYNRGRSARLGYLVLASRDRASAANDRAVMGAFAGVLALAVLDWAAPSGAGSPVVSTQLRVPAERSTDGGQTTGFVNGGRIYSAYARWYAVIRLGLLPD